MMLIVIAFTSLFVAKFVTPNVNLSNWISFYYPSTNSWSRATSIPGLLENHVLKGFAMIVIEESIYVIGGRQCYKDVEGVETNDYIQEIDIEVVPSVLKYSVQTDIWSKCLRFMILYWMNGNNSLT